MQKSKLVTAALAYFFGGFGIHYIYIGNKKRGYTMLFAYLILGITIVVPFVLTLMGVIDAIRIIGMNDDEFKEFCSVNQGV